MSRTPHAGMLRLLAAGSAMAFVWLFVLPWLGTWPAVRERIRRNEAAEINPTAVYYTEHPAIDRVHQSIQNKIAREPAAFGFSAPELQTAVGTR